MHLMVCFSLCLQRKPTAIYLICRMCENKNLQTSLLSYNVSFFLWYQIGLSSALDTFCGQAFGAKEEASVGVHTQRAMLVLITICVPVSAVWNFTEPILIFIRQDRDVSAEAG